MPDKEQIIQLVGFSSPEYSDPFLYALTNEGRVFLRVIVNGRDGLIEQWDEMKLPDLRSR